MAPTRAISLRSPHQACPACGRDHAALRKTAREHPDPAAVEFRDVTVKRGSLTILNQVSASVPRGGSTMIVGPNGAGKTTLLLALLGEIPYQGGILLDPAAFSHPPRLGYVPQRLDMDRGMPLTVLEFLSMGLQRKPLWLGLRRGGRDRARALLDRVQAADLASRRLGALSGGELQRVLLALALEREPELLILDEPSAGVDLKGDYLFCELLEELRLRHGFTQIMVSHDLGMVAHHATHVICLRGGTERGVLAEGPPDKVFNERVLTALFGMHMGVLDLSPRPLPEK